MARQNRKAFHVLQGTFAPEQAVTLYHVRAPLVVSAVQAAALLLASFAQRGHFVLEVRRMKLHVRQPQGTTARREA